MTLSSPDSQRPAAAAILPSVVFRGSKPLCQEFSLVLEAKSIDHDMLESAGGTWVLAVDPALVYRAYEEMNRYSAERSTPRSIPTPEEPFRGAVLGSMVYLSILLFVAYCAGISLFDADWLSLGALNAGAGGEWWRALTALTLHLDQEHLLGNLLFGVFAGIAAGRLLGPGVAWASILGAGGIANYMEILISPPAHRAVGASTAVFAALGLLAGLAWRQRLTLRERRWYRWAPMISGVCLLTLLGAGSGHVDVLGHALGFLCGVAMGWVYAHSGMPRSRGSRLQILTGIGAALVIGTAWFAALGHAGALGHLGAAAHSG